MKNFILLFSILLVFEALAEERITIAILDLEAKGVSAVVASTLSDRIRSEMFQTGKYTVLEREGMSEILEEQGLQMAVCTTSDCIVEAGKMLGVQQMVGGSISKLGGLYSITLRMINVETGRIEGVATVDCDGCSIEIVAVQTTKEVVMVLVGEEPIEVGKKKGSKKWLYIGGATVVAGVTAYLILGKEEETTGSITIEVPPNP